MSLLNKSKQNSKENHLSLTDNERLLAIYTKLINGHFVKVKEEAQIFGVDEERIQGDIEDIRMFFEKLGHTKKALNRIVYDKEQKAYHLAQLPSHIILLETPVPRIAPYIPQYSLLPIVDNCTQDSAE